MDGGTITRARRGPTPKVFDEARFRELHAQKLSESQLATQFGVAKGTIHRTIKRLGLVPARAGGRPRAVDDARIVELWEKGWTDEAVGLELNISDTAVRSYRRRMGLKSKSREYMTTRGPSPRSAASKVSHWTNHKVCKPSTPNYLAKPVTWEIPVDRPPGAIEVNSCQTLANWLLNRGAEVKQLDGSRWLIGRVEMGPDDLLARCNREAFLIGKPPFVWSAI